jgi:hypothetical protein
MASLDSAGKVRRSGYGEGLVDSMESFIWGFNYVMSPTAFSLTSEWWVRDFCELHRARKMKYEKQQTVKPSKPRYLKCRFRSTEDHGTLNSKDRQISKGNRGKRDVLRCELCREQKHLVYSAASLLILVRFWRTNRHLRSMQADGQEMWTENVAVRYQEST